MATLAAAGLFLVLLAPAAAPLDSACTAQMPCNWSQLCDANNPCPMGCRCTYPQPGRAGYCR
jgi:hypothetical protein